MTWEIWEADEGHEITLTPSDHIQKKEEWFLGKDAKLVKSFEADSWEEAKHIQKEFYDWD